MSFLCTCTIGIDEAVKNKKQHTVVKKACKGKDGFNYSEVWANLATKNGDQILDEEGDELLAKLAGPPLKKGEDYWKKNMEPAFETHKDRKCFSYRPYAEQKVDEDDVRVAPKEDAPLNGEASAWRKRYLKGKLKRGKYGDATTLTYGEVHNKVKKTGYLIETLKGKGGDGLHNDLGDSNVAIWGKNCLGYYLTIMACWRQNCAFVPLYDTLGVDSFTHILGNTGCKVLFLQKTKLEELFKILENREYKNPYTGENTPIAIETVVIYDHLEARGDTWDAVTDEDRDRLGKVGVSNVYGFWEWQRSCDAGWETCEPTVAAHDDNAIIMSTSGTTGLPKGVVISRATLGVIRASLTDARSQDETLVKPGWKHYSYLPLGHIMEVAGSMGMICEGLHLFISCGDLTKIADELNMIKPNIMICVPRVLQKFYDKVKGLEGKKGNLVNSVVDKQTAKVKDGNRNCLYDLVIKLAMKKLGMQNVRMLVTGSAPLSNFLHTFWRTMLYNGFMVQGYGMTETSIVGTIGRRNDPNPGHCGPPMPGAFIMLRDNEAIRGIQVDGENCSVSRKEPTGEIMIGGTIGKEYYRQVDKTAETFIDLHGIKWVASGDIGRMNTKGQMNGTLSIVGRVKSIFKLGQGEYIAPNEVETKYLKLKPCNQIWIYGHPEMNTLVSVVVPAIDWVWGQPWFTSTANPGYKKWHDPSKGVHPKEGSKFFMEWLEEDPSRKQTVKDAVWKIFEKEVGTSGLKVIKTKKAFYLECELGELATGFTVENGLVTPSMKMQRPKLETHYLKSGVLWNLYDDKSKAAAKTMPSNWEKPGS